MVYQKLATSKQDDDVKISVVLREAPDQTQRQFAGVHLKTNQNWAANDFRHDTKESDPMEVDSISKGKGDGKSNSKGKSKSKGTKLDNQDKECHVCGKKGHLA